MNGREYPAELLAGMVEQEKAFARKLRAFNLSDWPADLDDPCWKALDKITNLFPWMVSVAEMGYKEEHAIRLMQREATRIQILQGDLEKALYYLNDPELSDSAKEALEKRNG